MKRRRDRSYFMTRSLISLAVRANKPPPAPSPTVRQLEDGRWAIVSPNGAEMAVAATNGDAWAWIDRHCAEAARDIDRTRRIKASATFS